MIYIYKRNGKIRKQEAWEVTNEYVSFRYASGGYYYAHPEDIIGHAESFKELRIKYPEYFI